LASSWAAPTSKWLLAVLLLAGCTPTTDPTSTSASATTTPESSTTRDTMAADTTTTTSEPSTTAATPVYSASVSAVTETELAHSWQEGCPVGPTELVRIDLVHHDFESRVRPGRLIVHRDHAAGVVGVFRALFESGYPIQSMIPIGELDEGAEDQSGYSNTSGFHCRFVEGTTRWSVHAVGGAIDINPHLNPIIRGDDIWPIGSETYADRSRDEPGMIFDGDEVTTAFDAIGWGWGGGWQTLKDYHHFSYNSR
jgi:hypothetical protein